MGVEHLDCCVQISILYQYQVDIIRGTHLHCPPHSRLAPRLKRGHCSSYNLFGTLHEHLKHHVTPPFTALRLVCAPRTPPPPSPRCAALTLPVHTSLCPPSMFGHYSLPAFTLPTSLQRARRRDGHLLPRYLQRVTWTRRTDIVDVRLPHTGLLPRTTHLRALPHAHCLHLPCGRRWPTNVTPPACSHGTGG